MAEETDKTDCPDADIKIDIVALFLKAVAPISNHPKDLYQFRKNLDLSCCIRDLGHKLAINENCFVFHSGQGPYKNKSREEKEKQIWKNYYTYESSGGHLYEHRGLLRKMSWAGRKCPI